MHTYVCICVCAYVRVCMYLCVILNKHRFTPNIEIAISKFVNSEISGKHDEFGAAECCKIIYTLRV